MKDNNQGFNSNQGGDNTFQQQSIQTNQQQQPIMNQDNHIAAQLQQYQHQQQIALMQQFNQAQQNQPPPQQQFVHHQIAPPLAGGQNFAPPQQMQQNAGQVNYGQTAPIQTNAQYGQNQNSLQQMFLQQALLQQQQNQDHKVQVQQHQPQFQQFQPNQIQGNQGQVPYQNQQPLTPTTNLQYLVNPQSNMLNYNNFNGIQQQNDPNLQNIHTYQLQQLQNQLLNQYPQAQQQLIQNQTLTPQLPPQNSQTFLPNQISHRGSPVDIADQNLILNQIQNQPFQAQQNLQQLQIQQQQQFLLQQSQNSQQQQSYFQQPQQNPQPSNLGQGSNFQAASIYSQFRSLIPESMEKQQENQNDHLLQIKQVSQMNASYGVKKPKKLSGQISSDQASAGTGDGKKENVDNSNNENQKEENSAAKSEDSKDTAQKERGQSAPAKFDQNTLNHFGIDNDCYSKQFTQGNIEQRMDPSFWEFYRQKQLQQQKEQQLGQINVTKQNSNNLPDPITASTEEEMLLQLKNQYSNQNDQNLQFQKQQRRARGESSLSPSSRAKMDELHDKLDSQKNENLQFCTLPSVIDMKKSKSVQFQPIEDNHSKFFQNLRNENFGQEQKRDRLSTISSEQNQIWNQSQNTNQNAIKSPAQIKEQKFENALHQEQRNQEEEYRRRQSSYTDMLDDPIRYMEAIKKTLDQGEEDLSGQVGKGQASKRNRTGSFIQKESYKTPLEEIDEEESKNENPNYREADINFIKDQFQQFTIEQLSPQGKDQLLKDQSLFADKGGLDNLTFEMKMKKVQSHVVHSRQEQDLVPPMQEQQSPDLSSSAASNQLQEPLVGSQDMLANQQHLVRPPVDVNLPVSQIAKIFGLVSTYDTLEGHQKLSRQELLNLLEYSPALAKDQGGCRFLQTYVLNSINSNDKQLFDHIFISSINHCWNLMNDSFGNYLIQKLADNCDDQQLTKIIEQMRQEPVALCKDTHGTRSVQKLIEVAKIDDHFQLIQSYFMYRIKEMSEDINGNHVIQKILQCWQQPRNQFLYDAMINQCVQIACHKHGCCIMQKCIDSATIEQKRALTHQIAVNTLTFVKNPFGNYVVQFVLEMEIKSINVIISRQLMSDIIQLSKQKFSSNVIEKCLEHNTTEMNQEMVQHIMNEKNHYFNLLSDKYGNYVIQKCLQVAVEPQLSKFINDLQSDVQALATNNDFSYKIYQRLVKKYPSLHSNSELYTPELQYDDSNQFGRGQRKNQRGRGGRGRGNQRGGGQRGGYNYGNYYGGGSYKDQYYNNDFDQY